MRQRQRSTNPERPSARLRLAHAAKAALCVACSFALAFGMTGCRDSDALKEIIYDQTAEIIDYDNEEKFLINDPESDVESNDVSSDEAAAVGKQTERTQNIVVYSSEPNSIMYNAKESIWDYDPDFEGLEASLAVWFVVDEDDEEEEEEETAPTDEATSYSSESTDSSAIGTEGYNSSEGSTATGDSSDSGEESSETAESTGTDDGTGGGGNGEIQVVTTTGDFDDPPSVDTIAAWGQLAVIVQMVGGEGALAAADSDLLDESGFQTVFADEGAADIAVGWNGDGSDASTIDVQAIIDSGADTILVDSDDYENALSDEDKDALNEAGIFLTQVSSLISSDRIRSVVTTIGQMLEDSSDIGNAGKTTSIAKEYVSFHDDLLDAVVDANNDAIAGSEIYERRTTNYTSYSYKNNAPTTLLIDEWDDSVSWSGDGSLTMNGIGLSTVGYATSPVSFYIQVGGLVNNAAARFGTSYNGMYAAWQFGAGYRLYKSNFSFEADGAYDESIEITTSISTWEDVLFIVATGSSGESISGSLGGLPKSNAFGSDDFPVVIAATQHIKEMLIDNSAEEDGAYHPYDIINPLSGGDSMITRLGVMGDTGMWASIGYTGKYSSSEDNAFYSADGNVISDDAVVVNPHGLFTSWTEEGSVEAVLEAAWVNDVASDNDTTVGWKDYVEEFYSTFYRYDLSSSELSEIEAGLEE